MQKPPVKAERYSSKRWNHSVNEQVHSMKKLEKY
jgi:hypothetical protein